MIEATKDADFVILVTEPTPFGLHDLKLAVETMKELNKDFGVVINRYGIGNNDVEDYCKDNNIPIIAKIPNEQKIAELIFKRRIIYTKFLKIKNEFRRLIYYFINLKISELR